MNTTKELIEKAITEINDVRGYVKGKGDFAPDERRQIIGDGFALSLQYLAQALSSLDGVVQLSKEEREAALSSMEGEQDCNELNLKLALDECDKRRISIWRKQVELYASILAKLAPPTEKCTCPIPYTKPENCCEVSLTCPVHGEEFAKLLSKPAPCPPDVCVWRKQPGRGVWRPDCHTNVAVFQDEPREMCQFCDKKIEVK